MNIWFFRGFHQYANTIKLRLTRPHTMAIFERDLSADIRTMTTMKFPARGGHESFFESAKSIHRSHPPVSHFRSQWKPVMFPRFGYSCFLRLKHSLEKNVYKSELKVVSRLWVENTGTTKKLIIRTTKKIREKNEQSNGMVCGVYGWFDLLRNSVKQSRVERQW